MVEPTDRSDERHGETVGQRRHVLLDHKNEEVGEAVM